MQANELKAVLAVTSDVACRPVPICYEEATKRNKATRRSKGWGAKQAGYSCPIGLTKATVLATGQKWVESRPVSICGDQDYNITRMNGVLIEFDWTDDLLKKWKLKKKGKMTVLVGKGAQGSEYKLTEVVERDGQKFIRMVVNAQVIYSSWGEYALEQAKIQKDNERRRARQEVLLTAQAGLMGVTLEDMAAHTRNGSHNAHPSLNADYVDKYVFDKHGEHVREKDGTRKTDGEYGRVQITLDQANKILGLLTPAQKKKLAESSEIPKAKENK